MGASFHSSGDEEVISGINITPLVDVVLVLLIIFLITAPVIYQSAIKVRLAQASTGESTKKDESVNIAITRSGELTWNDQTVNRQALERHLKDLGSAVSEKTALISADRDTPHGLVMELIDTLRAAGLTHLAFNVEKKTPVPATP